MTFASSLVAGLMREKPPSSPGQVAQKEFTSVGNVVVTPCVAAGSHE